MGAADRPQRQLKPTQRARSGATRQTVTGVRPASKPIARRRKPKAKTSAATKVADAEEGTAPDIIMKEPDIPSIQEAAAEPATADGSEGAGMEIQEEELSEDDSGVLDARSIYVDPPQADRLLCTAGSAKITAVRCEGTFSRESAAECCRSVQP
jgi:hypothetical protein